ncbi:MAG: DUF1097 domain-containing protein [Mesonia hippocampi]|uniref:DUF1097 domain-containing protein n=1 Tax=Mesonia hippocampi TaxID=1628250 RepID=UPI003F98256C
MEITLKNSLKSTVLGLLAALSIYICMLLQLPAWVLFIGWSTYALFCTTKTNTLISFLEETTGMLLAYFINIFGVYLNSYIPEFGILLSVFVIVALLYWVTKLKLFNNLITYFLGMTAWFSYPSDSLNDLPMLTLSLGLGIGFGYVYSLFDLLISNYKYNGKQN